MPASGYIRSKKKRKPGFSPRFFTILAIIVLVLVLPAIVLLTGYIQRLGSNASGGDINVPPQICTGKPANIMLMIDTSNSIQNQLSYIQEAAKNFIDIVSTDSAKSTIGLTTFNQTATLVSPFTNNYPSLKAAVDGITTGKNTCMSCAVSTVNQAFRSPLQTNKNVVILISDGNINWTDDPSYQNPVTHAIAQQSVFNNIAKEQHISYYTIGVTNKVDTQFLSTIAQQTGGQYAFTPDPTQLMSIYQQFAGTIGKGTISRTVFNDANNNGIFDQGEAGLTNWTVDLKSSSGNTLLTTQLTDQNGNYTFPGLCDGSYSVNEESVNGWQQTVPLNPSNYEITVSNGDNHPNTIFGNIAIPLTLPISPTGIPLPTGIMQPPAGNPPQPTPPAVSANWSITKNILYLNNFPSKWNPTGNWYLHLYVPNPAPIHPAPLVIYLHGIGDDWKSYDQRDDNKLHLGEKVTSATEYMARQFFSNGYMIAVLDYPMYYPPDRTSVEAAKAAVRFFRANAATYNVDSSRIMAWGDSGGGVPVIALAVTNPADGFDDVGGNYTYSSRVEGSLDWFGFQDHTSLDYIKLPSAPILIQHGLADTDVPIGTSIHLLNKLESTGIFSALQEVAHASHEFNGGANKINPDYFDFTQQAITFFNTLVRDNPNPQPQ